MSGDDRIREILNESIEPAPVPEGLTETLAAAATAGGGIASVWIIGAVALVAGLVGGIVGLTTSSQESSGSVGAPGLAAVPVYVCPGDGETGTLERGDRVYVVGRSGEWLAVRNVRGGMERVFVHSDNVTLDSAMDDVPEASCDEAGILASLTTTTTITPTTSTTILESSTTTLVDSSTTTSTAQSTTSTTQPAATTTTQPKDTTAPSFGQLIMSPAEIYEQNGLGISCPPGTARQSTISVDITDAVGVTSVRATWTDPQGSKSVNLSRQDDTWFFVFGPYPAGTWNPGDMDYEHDVTFTITARDAAGNESKVSDEIKVWEIGKCFG